MSFKQIERTISPLEMRIRIENRDSSESKQCEKSSLKNIICKSVYQQSLCS